MIVATVMKREVVTIPASATISDAVEIYANNHIGTLPVIDEDGRLVGILMMRDLLKLVMPSFLDLMDDFDFVVGDFGIFEELRPSPQTEAHPVTELMEDPISVKDQSGLLLAFAILDDHDLYDIPVVDEDNKLVGLASRVDIGTALLAHWHSGELGADTV